jgi:hypothetical protein
MSEYKKYFKDNLCGCGRTVRYSKIVKNDDGSLGEKIGACNKYRRCPSYKELEDKIEHDRKALAGARDIIKVLSGMERDVAIIAAVEWMDKHYP